MSKGSGYKAFLGVACIAMIVDVLFLAIALLCIILDTL